MIWLGLAFVALGCLGLFARWWDRRVDRQLGPAGAVCDVSGCGRRATNTIEPIGPGMPRRRCDRHLPRSGIAQP